MSIDNTLFVDVVVEQETEQVEITVEESSGGGLPYYTGSYEVIPRKTEITLPTKNKSMSKDVTVFQIPYSAIPNRFGGDTVTIGLE